MQTHARQALLLGEQKGLTPWGTLPPDPLGFSAFLLSQVVRFEPLRTSGLALSPGPAPESALGLLPSRALSSARSLLVYSKGSKPCKTKLLTRGSALIQASFRTS